jgi:hypothetical protein
LAAHTLLWQSLPTIQLWLVAHLAKGAAVAHPPPQSLSVSVPFFTPSVQAGPWHVHGGVGQRLFTPQMPVLQSPPHMQDRDTSHRAQGPSPAMQLAVPPPQSISDSSPFLTTSTQVAGWHVEPGPGFAAHTPLWQSAFTTHVFTSAQRGHEASVPPQSMSVSLPFLAPSGGTQVAALHTPPVHTPLRQSTGSMHAWPSAHPPQSRPQST